MFCPKCHTELSDNTKFCKRCGNEITNNKKSINSFSTSQTFKLMGKYNGHSVINNNQNIELLDEDNNENSHNEQFDYSKVNKKTNITHNEQYNYSQSYSNTQTPIITSDEDYIEAYVGDNYKSIKEQKLSFPSLVFGPIYLIYRKLYFIGFILLFIELILSVSNIDNINFIIGLIINIYFMYKFKDIYLDNVEKKVEEIKYKNPDKSSNEILKKCKKAGSTLKFEIIIVIILLSIIGSIIAEAILIMTNNELIPTEENNIIIKNMEYTAPKNYTTKNDDSSTYHFYGYHKDEGSCYVFINTNKISIDTEKYIDELYKYDIYNEKTQTETITINNIEWKNKVYINEKNKKYVYATKYNNEIYAIRFENKYTEYDVCEPIKDEILNSVKFN